MSALQPSDIIAGAPSKDKVRMTEKRDIPLNQVVCWKIELLARSIERLVDAFWESWAGRRRRLTLIACPQ